MDNASIQAFLKAAIIPLDGVAEVSRFTYVNLGRDARGVEELWRVLDQPLQLGTVRIDEVPVYFEIIGQLHERAQYVCDPNQDIDHLSDMAFCGWFEPRRSVVSELQWDRYAVCLRKLHALVSDTVVGTEELYVPDAETGLIRIQAGSFSSAERRVSLGFCYVGFTFMFHFRDYPFVSRM